MGSRLILFNIIHNMDDRKNLSVAFIEGCSAWCNNGMRARRSKRIRAVYNSLIFVRVKG